jgi:hypothetical protein
MAPRIPPGLGRHGTVFEITRDGTYHVLYEFPGGNYGEQPS